MIEIVIKKNKDNSLNKNSFTFSNGSIVTDRVSEIKIIKVSKKIKFIFYGKINYIQSSEKIYSSKHNFLQLKKILRSKNFKDLDDIIEGKYLIIKINKDKIQSIVTDKFCKMDLFYKIEKNRILVSDIIKNFSHNYLSNYFNSSSVASMLMNYGSYVPKSKTIYSDINRLNIGEYFELQNNTIHIKKRKIDLPKTSEQYDKNEELYHEKFKSCFLNSIKKRSSKKMNWVFISSGYDSTSVLAALNYLVGNKKITAVIAELKYSNKYGVCNQFEIERAQKICDYYKIPLRKIKIDYSNKNIIKQMREVRTHYTPKHIFSITSNNFFQIAKYIKKNGSFLDSVFNGDLSDGLQNFGFSQFATILDHSSLNFREYSDKMFSYLYGPSFFRKVVSKNFLNDKIFNYLLKEKQINLEKKIKKLNKNKYLFKFLSPIFLSPTRFPFTKIYNEKLITRQFSKKYTSQIYKNYFKKIIERLKPNSLYSSIIYLYNIFHWNSGTVQCCIRAPETLGIKSATPFWDKNLQEFFSIMPESWGRGLEMRNTKFALKFFLKNKIDYPLNLQSGPHSYIYDVDPKWSADIDILYHSYLRKEFIRLLKNQNFKKIFKSQIFNIKYIKHLLRKYYRKQYVYGHDLLTLKNLIIFTFFVLDDNSFKKKIKNS